MVQLSHLYMTTEETIALTRWTFVSKVVSLLFNTLSRFVIAFLPRSKRLLISWLQSPSMVILEPKKRNVTSSTFSFLFAMKWQTRCHDLSFLALSFKPTFSLSSSPLSGGSLVPHFSSTSTATVPVTKLPPCGFPLPYGHMVASILFFFSFLKKKVDQNLGCYSRKSLSYEGFASGSVRWLQLVTIQDCGGSPILRRWQASIRVEVCSSAAL